MQNLHQLQERFEQYLADNRFDQSPTGLYGPANYILELGGKRLRPAVLLMSCLLFDDDYEQALPAAFAIEIFHNFSLVHDDIMDAAPLRRGKPTVHEKYGLNTGILSGDVMLVLAYDYLLKLEKKEAIPALFSIFTKTAIGVCEGQQMDMDFETCDDVSIANYLKMIELKTSVLVAGAMEMGALLGGANAEDAAHLYEFGRNLGIAFQVQDDLLDAFGDPEKFGKKPGGDIAQNKKTILYLKALELADPATADHLKNLFKTSPDNQEEKITAVLEIFNQLKIKEFTEKLKEEYAKTAFLHLSKVAVPEDRKALMHGFAQALMQRES